LNTLVTALEKLRRIAWQPTIGLGIGFLIGLQKRSYISSCSIEEKIGRRVSLAAVILDYAKQT
jgi:hypothetical protein